MTYEAIAKLTDRQQRVLAAVLCSPYGMTAQHVAVSAGSTMYGVTNTLRALRDLGLVGATTLHRDARWVRIDRIREARVYWSEWKREQIRRKKREEVRKLREEAGRLSDAPMVFKVKASDCSPIRPRGPISIFDIGAAA